MPTDTMNEQDKQELIAEIRSEVLRMAEYRNEPVPAVIAAAIVAAIECRERQIHQRQTGERP